MFLDVFCYIGVVFNVRILHENIPKKVVVFRVIISICPNLFFLKVRIVMVKLVFIKIYISEIDFTRTLLRSVEKRVLEDSCWTGY